MFRPGMEKLPVYSVEEPLWEIKLDANERSAKLSRTLQNELNRRLRVLESRRYPDMGAGSLRSMLAEAFGLTLEQVTLGNGSSELVAAICGAFGGPGRPIAYQWPSFSMYPIYAALADSPVVAVSLDADFGMSVDAVLETVVKSKASLLILCNPNNPTGTVTPPAVLREIIGRSPCPVLVDEAYHEYYGESCLPWLAEFSNLMVARTFSKAFGLAAARVGYLLASAEISAAVSKRLLPYHMNSYSLAAAEACFSCRENVMQEVRRTAKRRDRMRSVLARIDGLEVFPSATNFLLLRVEDPADLYKRFADRGIGVRNLSHNPELSGCMRVTVGSPEENRRVCECVLEYGAMQSRSKGGGKADGNES